MTKQRSILCAALALILVGATPVLAASEDAADADATEINYLREYEDPTLGPVAGMTINGEESTNKIGIGPIPGFVPPLAPTAIFQQTWICRAFNASEVTGFNVSCAGATFLDTHVADVGIPGDHWQAKGKNWSTHPNTAVTTAPGPVFLYGVPGRNFNYGGTIFNPGNIDAYVECTPKPDNVDVFPADGLYSFSSDGICVVTPDPVRRRIDRAP